MLKRTPKRASPSSTKPNKKLVFPPLVQFMVYGLFGYFLSKAIPALNYNSTVTYWAAIPLAVIGLTILLQAVRSFGKANTTVSPIEPDKTYQLLTSGLYRISRNPMYLGMLLVMMGGALLVQNTAAFSGPIAFVISITALQIKPEERILKQKFGVSFEAYCRQTRRWI